MKIKVIGSGSFGGFLNELLFKDSSLFEFDTNAKSIILAVPISAYDSVTEDFKNCHLINVCSVQKPSMEILLKHTERVTGIHPLFGKRTPADKRNAILTYQCNQDNDTWKYGSCPEEVEFLTEFGKLCNILHPALPFTPESHDVLMARTHFVAVMAAKQMKFHIDRSADIPDELIPNSFRLLREFVKTLDDMPQGTIESILANPYV